jgi:hypothetical protein
MAMPTATEFTRGRLQITACSAPIKAPADSFRIYQLRLKFEKRFHSIELAHHGRTKDFDASALLQKKLD